MPPKTKSAEVSQSDRSDLSAYATEVIKLAGAKTNKRIPNSGVGHAAIVFENLFAIAHRDIKIFTGALKESHLQNSQERPINHNKANSQRY